MTFFMQQQSTSKLHAKALRNILVKCNKRLIEKQIAAVCAGLHQRQNSGQRYWDEGLH